MSLEITGRLHAKYDTQQVSERFRKREVIIELTEEINGNNYTNYAKMQLVQNKCELLDKFNEGDNVKVSFNIKGNRWEKDGKVNYITSLDIWRMEKIDYSEPRQHTASPHDSSHTVGQGPNYTQAPETESDLPF